MCVAFSGRLTCNRRRRWRRRWRRHSSAKRQHTSTSSGTRLSPRRRLLRLRRLLRPGGSTFLLCACVSSRLTSRVVGRSAVRPLAATAAAQASGRRCGRAYSQLTSGRAAERLFAKQAHQSPIAGATAEPTASRHAEAGELEPRAPRLAPELNQFRSGITPRRSAADLQRLPLYAIVCVCGAIPISWRRPLGRADPPASGRSQAPATRRWRRKKKKTPEEEEEEKCLRRLKGGQSN